jgi:23S rRNA pseudouridine1911/1915/1917 synthase
MTGTTESHTVDGAARLRRIDRYLAELQQFGSRARVQKMIAAGMVQVDGATVSPDTIVRPGQVITVSGVFAEAAPSVAEPEEIPLTILFEDESILVVDKPAGLVVHPAAGNQSGTLVAAVLHHWQGPRPGLDPLRPGLVHRLDKDTSGVIVIAKDAGALADLAAQFKARSVAKQYLAFVWGRPANTAGVIDAPLGRHPVHRKRMAIRDDGRPARTRYEVTAGGAGMSLLRVWPETGRTHQIRVHLVSLGTPIVGDAVYGGARRRPAPAGLLRQALHAARLTLRHPATGVTMTFESPLPGDLQLLERELHA